MRVNLEDGWCRSCGGALEIIECDDATFTVFCAECGESYALETDALGDACKTFYSARITKKMEEGEDEEA